MLPSSLLFRCPSWQTKTFVAFRTPPGRGVPSKPLLWNGLPGGRSVLYRLPDIRNLKTSPYRVKNFIIIICCVRFRFLQHPVTRSSRAIDTISTHEGQQKGCASSTLSDLIEVKHVPANVLFRQYYRPHSCVASDPLEASALPLELRFRASKQLYRPIISGKKEIALPLRVS